MTLAPGGLGGAVVSDNITVHHVLNVKRLAYEVRRPPEAAWTEPGRTATEAAALSVPDGSAPEADVVARVVRQVLAEMRR
jgi:acetaldehyde dehydrogenase (acetylating)